MAVIDTPEGLAPRKPDASVIADIVHDLQTIVSVWFSHDTIIWLHTNHLGATEAATDAKGKLVWQARYAPFGQATISSGSGSGQSFTLNLRLPGQYADAETGLFYNRQRYYDPERGQYLTPDPLGTPNGPNGYAYVRYNLLKYVDSEGLVLFAFDGTENSNPVLKPGVDTLSNVVEFQGRYLSDNSETQYISGVGTVDISDPSRPILAPDGSFGHKFTPDKGFNYSGPARIDRMIEYFGKEADIVEDNTAMEVDIIGFSRGAAQARDFANQIAAKTKNGWYSYTDLKGKVQCQKVDFRFMGLWDTVLSKNNSGHVYNLGIPDQFRNVSQAVALNEFRGNTFASGRPDPANLDSIGEFPLESIMGSPIPIGQKRSEKGFLGSHSDIGGGFTDNDLSTVALAWMVQQAKGAGVTMKDEPIDIPDTAVLHDKSNNIQTGAPNKSDPLGGSEDRTVVYRNGAKTTQRVMKNTGMTFAETNKYISYADRSALTRADGTYNRNSELVNNFIMTNVTGMVDMENYVQWLRKNGYNLGNITGAGSK
jgi:RHS repeat-associated protein